MRPQREKPGISKAQLEATLGVPPSDKNLVSGGQFENFREGWAHYGFGTGDMLTHYFRRDGFDRAVAKCGFDASVRWLFGPGNLRRCRRCQPPRTLK